MKKKIVIATPLYPPDIGGPATYARGLEAAFRDMGYEPIILSYKRVLCFPSYVRQVVFMKEMFRVARKADAIIALDTLSVGLPAAFIGKLFHQVVVIRVAGDQLWEHYVNRTKEPVPFSEFYQKKRRWNLHEHLIHLFSRFTFFLADEIVFSTRWQEESRIKGYPCIIGKSVLIENAYHVAPDVRAISPLTEKRFLWAGRDIPLKNIERLKEAFEIAKKHVPDVTLDLLTDVSHQKVLDHIKNSFALILPSFSEDSPNFLLEGISCGKPFISTMHNGLKDRIGGLGIFVDPFDVSALVQAITDMSHEEVYREYIHRIKTYRFKRTYHDVAKDYISLIESP